MRYDFTAIPDADVPQAIEPVFQHVGTTYASEANKTVGVWRAEPDALLDFKPHEKTNTIRTMLVHQFSPSGAGFPWRNRPSWGLRVGSVLHRLIAGDRP